MQVRVKIKKPFELKSMNWAQAFTVSRKTRRLSESQGFPLGGQGVAPRPDSFLRKASKYFQTRTGIILRRAGSKLVLR